MILVAYAGLVAIVLAAIAAGLFMTAPRPAPRVADTLWLEDRL